MNKGFKSRLSATRSLGAATIYESNPTGSKSAGWDLDHASLKTIQILTLNKKYVFHFFLKKSCYIKKIFEMAVLKNSFYRFRKSLLHSGGGGGGGIWPQRNPLGWESLTKGRALMVVNLTKKCQCRGGMGTLGFGSYITYDELKIALCLDLKPFNSIC